MKRFWKILAATILALPMPLQAQEVGGIYPQSLEGRESYELGDLIYQLIPGDETGEMPWNHMANSGILWVTDGVEEFDDGTSFRVGFVRVNVMGEVSTVLRNMENELGWTVSYVNQRTGKFEFGVDLITLSPGIPGDDCYESINFSGCTFSIEESILDSRLEIESTCYLENHPSIGYAVTAAGKLASSVFITSGGGNSAPYTSVTIVPGGSLSSDSCVPI